jgi:hypothetical protein
MPRILLVLLAFFFSASSVFADAIPIEPGLWEMKSTMVMPMLPEPRVTTVTECMEKSEFSIDEMGIEGMDPNCTFDTNQVNGNTMRWTFDCPLEGGTSHGEWEAVSNGDTVEGSGVMTMSFQGQNMEMTMQWEGQRVGDCP